MLTTFDKSLLNLIQRNLPITERPFLELANILETTEEHVIERLRYLKEHGYIRRIGPFFDSGKLEYKGTLVALKVQEGYMQQVAEFINKYPGATHNYQREGEYNLWFTLLTHSEEKRKQILDEIKAQEGVEKLMNLVSNKKYKINVQFKLK
ncbi:MAG TPA: Lrp/AsnC family transcriptional regulator [Candidatus Megamonas gallistercoris]|nr:Lrp/AsnC family transcriptional regulator [Candidatus Megamonas gallistercoris]